jgi:ectoine hydroxylase-related dioxygenase (phytanoyl-CoA dioxygenase family)
VGAVTTLLTHGQIARYREEGVLVVEDAVTSLQLERMRSDIAGWVEQSRSFDRPFGEPTIDGRPRFDLGAEHRPDCPVLRRVNNPSDISAAFGDVMLHAAMVDMVADLIGSDVKFHHCKINLKLPGTDTEVGYHQDFAYTPHTNDDLVTALLMLDDMTLENGCLRVIPASHKGPIYSHYEMDHFRGFIRPEVMGEMHAKEVPITGRAGSVCLMHTRLVHGSRPNCSDRPRGLYIAVYTAADAVPLAVSPLPNPNEGRIVRGRPSRVARLTAGEIELPPGERPVSFFVTQGQKSA